MDKNSLEKKIDTQSTEYRRRPSDGVLEEILEEIPEMDSVRRSGLLQILLLPFLALLVITAVPLILSFTAFRQTNSPLARDFPYETIESELLNNAVLDIETKREELNQKDLTIRRYQDRIQTMDGNLKVLQELMEDSLRSWEQALLSEIETILLEERTRLEALGRGEQEVDRALERLKSGLETDYENKMDDFRAKELGAYQDRIEATRNERNNLEKALEATVEERKALALTLEESESELLIQIFEQPDYRSTETSVAKADLEMLENADNTENYWLDELANQYLGLFEALAVKDNEAALFSIEALESLFSDEIIASLPGIDARNEADREIIRFMSAYLQAREEVELESLLTEARLLIEQAEIHFAAGRLYEASIVWQQVEALWPLIGRAMTGSRATTDSTAAREARRYANLAEISLAAGDHEGAALVWEVGMEYLPDPLGNEIERWWKRWLESEAQRYSAKNAELAATKLAYEEQIALESEKYRLLQERLSRSQSETREFQAENQNLRAEITAMVAAEEESRMIPDEPIVAEPEIRYVDNPETTVALLAARDEIEVLEEQIRAMEEELALKSAPRELATEKDPLTTQWLIYGTIVQVLDETVIIEPLDRGIPSSGTDILIRRSLGGDRVIHLADGYILEADATRAVGAISSSTTGAEVYGSPKIDDLVYIIGSVED